MMAAAAAALLHDIIIASAVVGFVLFLLKVFVFDLFLFKIGKIQNWPKKFNVNVYLSLFTLSSILGLALPIPKINIQFQSHIILGIIFFGLLTLIVAICWFIFGYPIGRIFVSDSIVEDTRTVVPLCNNNNNNNNSNNHHHPVVIHFIKMTSGMMMGTFFLSFIVIIVAKFYHDLGEEKKTLAAMNVGHIIFSSMIIFISFYGFYFNTNIEMIVAKYEKRNQQQIKWMDNY